jgi:hypothetical protein
VRGDFAEDVAGEDAHFFYSIVMRTQCIAVTRESDFLQATRGWIGESILIGIS